jgi:hypothetical protein
MERAVSDRKRWMETTFSFTISTTNPTLAALLGKVVADFRAEHGNEVGAVQRSESPTDTASGENVDVALVTQIVDGLSYKPLHPSQTLALRTWYDASDWVHVGVLQKQVLTSGLAKDAAEATARVRGLLAGFAIRMEQKVAGAKKLRTLVDIRYANGSASHRLTVNGREAVKRVFKF